jgi:molybdopterin converting factor small subunit
MKIVCTLHAYLGEKLGRTSEHLELPAAATLKDATRALEQRLPGLTPLVPQLKFAVNDEFAGPETKLSDGDRIDLLPPFGGG